MMKRQQIILSVIVLLYVAIASCSKRQADEIVPNTALPGTAAKNITYTNFTQGLIQNKCAGCHAPGRSSASVWTFNGLTSIINNETRIKRVVLETRSMPLGGSMTADELKSLKEWFDNKMPE